jgi:hypothetical protein
MRVTTAHVENGRIEVDAGPFSEGQCVKVVILEEDPVILSEEERAWLREAIDRARSEEATDAFEFLRELENTR